MNDGVPRFPNTEFIRYLNQTGIITNYVNQEITIDELIAALQQKNGMKLSKNEKNSVFEEPTPN